MFKFLSTLLAFGGSTPQPATGSFSWKGYFAKLFNVTGLTDVPAATDVTNYNNYQSYLAAARAVDIIETALWIIIGVVGLAAVIYAVYLGIQLARAADQSKRDEAKKHLITVIIAIVVTLVLVIFFLYLLPGILGAFKGTTL